MELGLLMLMGDRVRAAAGEEGLSDFLKRLKLLEFGFLLPFVGEKVIYDRNCSIHLLIDY